MELEAERAADVVLVDRPLPDAIGYLTAALRSRAESLLQSESDYLNTLARIHVPTYNVLIMTEIDASTPLDTSKQRDTDLLFRQMAQVGIAEALKNAGVQPQILRLDNRNEVVRGVLQQIDEHLGPPDTGRRTTNHKA